MKEMNLDFFRRALGITVLVGQILVSVTSRAENVPPFTEITVNAALRQYLHLSSEEFVSEIRRLEIPEELKDFMIAQKPEAQIAELMRIFSLGKKSISSLKEEVVLNKERIYRILEDQKILVKNLLFKLTQQDLSTLRSLVLKQKGGDFDRDKVFVAAFSVKYREIFSIAKFAAMDDAKVTAENAVSHVSSDAVASAAYFAKSAAMYSAWHAASNAAFPVFGAISPSWTDGESAVWYTLMEAAFEPTSASVIACLNLPNSAMVGRASYLIAELLSLNWLRNHNAQQHFEKAYLDVYQKLDEGDKEDAEEFIQRHIGKPELADNPFILELKLFLDGVKSIISEVESS
jgi:hypothetical protein